MSHHLKCAVPEFHREMYQLIYEGHTRLVFCAPRSFAKSTINSLISPLYDICIGDISGLIILSATGVLAKRWLRKIKWELGNNKELIEDFGQMKTSDVWTQEEIICKRPDGSTVEVLAKGWGYQLRGFRPDKIIVDDIEKDEEVLSADMRLKQLNWFNKALINTLEPESQIVVVGTMMHPEGLLANVMERSQWIAKFYQAVLPDDTSLWPEKWSREALRLREEDIGWLAFQQEYQNQPILSENPMIMREWIQYYDEKSATFSNQLKDGIRTVVATDPAISRRESADYTANVTVSASFDAESTFYVRRRGSIRGRWTINEQVNKLVNLYDDFKSSKMIIETVGYQQALSDEVQLYLKNHRRSMVIAEMKPDKDKERRLHAVISLIESGRVKFAEDDPIIKILIDELIMFPYGKHDDLVDAFVYALTDAFKWSQRKSAISDKPYIVLPSKINEITGVSS